MVEIEALSGFENRRDDFRRSASNYRLKLRRHGLRAAAGFSECSLLDLSQGGMSFVSSTQKFRLLDAIDFELVSEAVSTRGRGAICYVDHHHGDQRCGVVFTQGDPELDALCSGERLSSVELQRLGSDIAEDFVARSGARAKNKHHEVRQRAVDAVSAFVTRLDQLGARIVGEAGDPVSPMVAVRVDEQRRISLPVRCGQSGGITRVLIDVEAGKDGTWCYTVGDQVRCPNVVDLLREVCERLEELRVDA